MPKLFSAAARLGLRRRPAEGSIRSGNSALRTSAAALAEGLEPRQLLSVAQDANGWTVVTPPKDARVIYVSSSGGDDDNDGRSPSSAVRSIHAGMALLRNHSGDQLLLKRGDTWHETFSGWNFNGESSGTPIVIGAYGTGNRPTVATGADNGLVIGGQVDHLALLGIDFYSDARDPESPGFRSTADNVAMRFFGHTDGLLVEDCVFRDYSTNVVLETKFNAIRHITFRRSQFLDAYSAGPAHSQGLFVDGVQGITLEGNLFDHNGWNGNVPGASATMFNHDVYITSATDGFVARGNIFANAASHGLQARSGGDVEDNVFIGDPIGLSFGLVNSSPVKPGGVTGIVNGNVFLGTRDISGAQRGMGLQLGNTAVGGPTIVSNNIFSHDDQVGPNGSNSSAGRGGFPAMLLEYGIDNTNIEQAVGLNDVNIQGNIVYDWDAGLGVARGIQPGGTGNQALNRVTLRSNDFQEIRGTAILEHDGPLDLSQEHWSGGRYDGNGWEGGWVRVEYHPMSFDKWSDDSRAKASKAPYTDPDRSAASYSQAIGIGSSPAGFVAAARSVSSQSWNPQYTGAGLIDYVRAGFQEPGAEPRNWLPPTPPSGIANVPTNVTTADTGLTFTVTYADDQELDVSTIGDGDVRFTGPNGYSAPATLVSVSGSGAGPVVATYHVGAPHPAWRRSDHGRYHLVMMENQVKDTQGFAVPDDVIAGVDLNVQQVPPPPQVRKLKFRALRHKPVTLSITLTSDVSGSLSAADLVLSDDLGQTIEPAQMTVFYDVKSRTATWSFPGLANGVLPAGRWHVRLLAAGISDAAGRMLDGNKDALGGDDFVWSKVFKSKG